MTEPEAHLREMLESLSTTQSALEQQLAAIIARRAQRSNHLWQDLGLRNRGELSELMQRHFAPLARKNTQDMKWKKFFSRQLCTEGAVPICTAPSCSECDDFDACFGDEQGETLITY